MCDKHVGFGYEHLTLILVVQCIKQPKERENLVLNSNHVQMYLSSQNNGVV